MPLFLCLSQETQQTTLSLRNGDHADSLRNLHGMSYSVTIATDSFTCCVAEAPRCSGRLKLGWCQNCGALYLQFCGSRTSTIMCVIQTVNLNGFHLLQCWKYTRLQIKRLLLLRVCKQYPNWLDAACEAVGFKYLQCPSDC